MDISAVTNRPPAPAPSSAGTPRPTEAPTHRDARRRRGRHRRLVPVAALTLAMAALLTACGDDDDPGTDQPSAQGIATAAPGEPSPPQITPPDPKKPTQSSPGAGSTARTTKPSGGGAVVEFELPAEVGGVPRLPQAGNPTVTRLVGQANAGYAKDLARVQTAVYGPSPTDQTHMVLLIVATRGPETTPVEYVGQSGPPGLTEVKIAAADKGVQRCWADSGRMICEWGDDNMFVSFWSAAGPDEQKAVEEQFIALRKQLTV